MKWCRCAEALVGGRELFVPFRGEYVLRSCTAVILVTLVEQSRQKKSLSPHPLTPALQLDV